MRATISARTSVDAGADDTHVERIKFEDLLACRRHWGAAAYNQRRLRYVPDLWAPSGNTLLAAEFVHCAPGHEMQWSFKKIIADLCQ
jgi:hypothetical protein